MKRTRLAAALLIPCILGVFGPLDYAHCDPNSVGENQCQDSRCPAAAISREATSVCPLEGGRYFSEPGLSLFPYLASPNLSGHDTIHDAAVYGVESVRSEAAADLPTESKEEPTASLDEQPESRILDDEYDWSYDDYEPYDDYESYATSEPVEDQPCLEDCPGDLPDGEPVEAFDADYEDYWYRQSEPAAPKQVEDSSTAESQSVPVPSQPTGFESSDEEYQSYDYDDYWHADRHFGSDDFDEQAGHLQNQDEISTEAIDLSDIARLGRIVQKNAANSQFSALIEQMVADLMENLTAAMATFEMDEWVNYSVAENSANPVATLPASEDVISWDEFEMWELIDLADECGLPDAESSDWRRAASGDREGVVRYAEMPGEQPLTLPHGESEPWMHGVNRATAELTLPHPERRQWRQAARISPESVESSAACVQAAVLVVARALDRTGQSLRTASRQLTEIVELSGETAKSGKRQGTVR